MKRSYYILGIIVTVAVVVGIFYFLRYRSEVVAPVETGNEQGVGLPPATTEQGSSAAQTPTQALPGAKTTTGGAVGTKQQKFGLVAQNLVFNYFVDSQSNAVIVQPDGQVVKITNAGQSVLSSVAITNLISADFSYDGNKILAAFGNVFAPQESIFDVAGKSWQPLGAGIKSIAWSPNDNKLVYLNNKNGSAALTTTDAANSKAKPAELLNIHAEDVNLYWPLQDKIIISDKPSSDVPGSIWAFNTKQKTLAQIGNAFGIESIWARGADLGLVFYAGDGGYGGSLALVNTQGVTVNSLTLLTLPSKCTFNIQQPAATSTNKTTASATSSQQNVTAATVQNHLYCAIPRDADKLRAASMPDDYEMKKILTSDNFYKIDLASGDLTRIFSDQSRSLDATNLKIFGDYLFFVNRYDQKLYWISLK